ncbi:MAG: hypothetical protein J6W47_03505 [Bacteroidales bacterium]|nr:hypothetical protein [Bacteroidales bacterium]
MFRIVLKTIGITLLIAYLAVCGWVWRLGQPEMVYREVRVVICDSTDTQFIDAEDILQVVFGKDKALNPVGRKAAQFNAYQLQQVLEQNTLIAQADCYPTPDSTLRIDIYQRKPILRIKSDKLTHDCYLDREGELMQYKPSLRAVEVPVATGHITREIATGPLYDLARFLRKHKRWSSDIVQIHVEKNGDFLLVPRKGSHVILLGPADDLETKFDNLDTFYRKVLDKKGWNLYQKINLKFKGQVVAEKKQQNNNI